MAEAYDVLHLPKWSQKWHIPILCCLITACNTGITGFIAIADINNSDWGSAEKKNEILEDYITISAEKSLKTYSGDSTIVCSILVAGAALVMIWFGYRVTAIIGSISIAVGLLVPTYLDGDDADAIGFCIAGLAGTGAAFLKLSALVPVIEYFKKGRMGALVLVFFGEVVGVFIVLGTIYIDGMRIDDLYWKKLYQYLMIPISVACLLSCGLKPLDLKLEKCSLKRIVGVDEWAFFKSLTLIMIVIMSFANSVGKNMADVSTLISDSDNTFGSTWRIVGAFTPIIGQLIGLVILFAWSKCSERKITTLLVIMIMVNFVAGLFTLPGGHYIGKPFALLASYGVIFGASVAVFENCLDDDIPEIFGNQHVRLMEGLIGLAVGVGEITLTAVITQVCISNFFCRS